MKKTLSISLVSIVYITAVAIGIFVTSPAYGCACGMLIPQKFKDIAMEGERGLVVFDSTIQNEQMAIDFQMNGSSSDSALIVPTPVKSEISQIKASVFDDIWQIIKPVVESSDSKSTALTASPNSVEVLERKVVGSFEIAVLKTNSYKDLELWTTDNGFYLQPEAQKPVEVYIDKGFILNVIKLKKGANENEINPLLFTFGTSKFFYPLMEIKDARDSFKDKSLSLFLITNQAQDLFADGISTVVENKEVSKSTFENEITKADDPEFSNLIFTSDKYYVNYITSSDYSDDESLPAVLGNSTSATDMAANENIKKDLPKQDKPQSLLTILLIYAAIIVPCLLVAGSIVYMMKRVQTKQQNQPLADIDNKPEPTEPPIEPTPEAQTKSSEITDEHDFVIPDDNTENTDDQKE